MKNKYIQTMFIVFFSINFLGCNSRLLGGRDDGETAPETILTGGVKRVGECPEMSSAQEGFTRNDHYAVLDETPDVQITNNSNSSIVVLLRDAGTWFQLGSNPSGAFYYSRPTVDVIRYHGAHIYGKEVCVFEFIEQ